MESLITDVHPKQLTASVWLGRSTTLARSEEVAWFAGEAVSTIVAALEEAGVKPTGPVSLAYNREHSEGPIHLRVGLPVADESTAPGLERFEFPAATVLTAQYVGPMSEITYAWDELVVEAQSRHLSVGTQLEIYNEWVGPDSPDDRTELQLVVG